MHDSLDRPWQLYRVRRYSLALEETMKFLAHYPESSEAHSLVALIHGKEKRQKQAIEAAENAIQYRPDWSYTHYVHGLVNYWFNQFQTALKSLSEALRIQPDEPDFYEIISAIHDKQGHPKTALQMADKGLEFNAQHVGCLYRRAVALIDLKQTREGEEVFRNILAIDAENGPSQGFVGHFLVLNGRYQEALPLLRNALRDNPDWTMAQNDWKEALRGRYQVYGLIGRLKQWIVETYRWRAAAIVFFVVCTVRFFCVNENSRKLPEFLVSSAIFGSFLTAGILLLLVLVFTCYLEIVSKIIFFMDPEIRKSFTWTQLLLEGSSESRKLFYGFLFIILLVVLINKLFPK